jgi:hypothetical protein
MERTEQQSSGERLVAYYTALKEHIREQPQLDLPLDASERRQEVLAFADRWQAEHGPVHAGSDPVVRDYAVVQERLAARQAPASEVTVAPQVDQGMELA